MKKTGIALLTLSAMALFFPVPGRAVRLVELANYSTLTEAWGVYTEYYGRTCVAAGGGIYLMNLDDLSSWNEPVFFDTPGNCRGVDHSGVYTYATLGFSGLQIIDRSGTTNPIARGSVDPGGFFYNVDVHGLYAYVAAGNDGLRVIHVSDADNPVALGRYDTDSVARDVSIQDGSTAFVASGTRGFYAINVSDPDNPLICSVRDTPGYAYGIHVQGDHVFIADGDEGVRVYNIDDPYNPEYTGRLVLPGDCYDIEVVNDTVYAAAGSAGLQIIDAANPASMKIIGSFDTEDARGVAVSGRRVCVADRMGGLRVLRVEQTLQDYDGDGESDLGVYPPAGDQWYIRSSATGGNLWNEDIILDSTPAMPVDRAQYSIGRKVIHYYDPYNGNWHEQASDWWGHDNFGWSRAIPVPGEYDRDFETDLAVYDIATGDWYLLYSSTGAMPPEGVINWGWNATVPVPGDYNGDAITDLAVYHPETGDWYIRYNSGSSVSRNFGWSDAAPVPADYDGDGITDIAVYHPAGGNWYIIYSYSGMTEIINWGWDASIPVPYDFDGDDMADIAVYYPATGNWYIRGSEGSSWITNWGWDAAYPLWGQYWLNKIYGLLD